MTEDYTAAELLRLDDEQFRLIVEDEARSATTLVGAPRTGNSPATSAALRAPTVVDRLYNELVVLQRGVEGRLATKKSHFDVIRGRLLGDNPGRPSAEYRKAKADYAAARAKSLRFKVSLDQTLMEVSLLRKQRNTSVVTERDALTARVRELEEGIRRWWASFDTKAADDYDRDLWRLVANANESTK